MRAVYHGATTRAHRRQRRERRVPALPLGPRPVMRRPCPQGFHLIWRVAQGG